jgi:chromate reductase
MSQPRDIAVIVGSLRKESFNRRIAQVMMDVAPSHLTCSFLEIGGLPHYNQDLETASPPAEWTAFRDGIRASQGVLFVMPEYNRSVPGTLKNAVDVGSRPPGHSVWRGKPAAVASVTQGPLGGLAGNLAMRQTLIPLSVPMLPAKPRWRSKNTMARKYVPGWSSSFVHVAPESSVR